MRVSINSSKSKLSSPLAFRSFSLHDVLPFLRTNQLPRLLTKANCKFIVMRKGSEEYKGCHNIRLLC